MNPKKYLILASLALIFAATAVAQSHKQDQNILPWESERPKLLEEIFYEPDEWWANELWADYEPFWGEIGKKLVSPRTPPSLQIDRDYPNLDGAVAFIPVYASAAKAIYRESDYASAAKAIHRESEAEPSRRSAVRLSVTTPEAYRALLDGRADIIFAFAPSEEQVKEAAEEGVTYTLTPIAKEAFVFLVNDQNPVRNLSIEQIRAIYSGKINDWREVGGKPGKIMAFQRNEGSGSQTAMLRNVMRETPMRKPFESEYHDEMKGLVRAVADYRNTDTAIGYSFRYYATVMYPIPGIRLLSIDNVEPTVENIRNGTYPLTDTFYMVTARPLSGNAQKLHDWFLSDEGQQLIEDVGYTPIRNLSRQAARTGAREFKHRSSH